MLRTYIDTLFPGATIRHVIEHGAVHIVAYLKPDGTPFVATVRSSTGHIESNRRAD